MYGHIATLAQKEKAGIEAAGGKADLYQYVDHARYIIPPHTRHFDVAASHIVTSTPTPAHLFAFTAAD